MAELEERVATLEMRVEKMDMDLKEHFINQQLFIHGALAGFEKSIGAGIDEVDKRLGARIDGVQRSIDARIDKMDADLKEHFIEFQAFVIETIGGVEKRMDARFTGVDARFDGIDSKLDTLLSRMPRRPRAVRRRKPRGRR